ncbi:MAG: CDP-alcohol phosphatidyltransferase family protein [Sphingomonas sp.]|nr:CDP-alcohol phosphatidyltransferase family protein [Sphingomonas sp.]
MKLSQSDGADQGPPRAKRKTTLAELPSTQSNLPQQGSEPTPKSDPIQDGAPDKEPGKPVHHVRVNNSFLGTHERNILQSLAARTPSAVTPDQLTLLGLVGALLVLVGFAACNASPWFVSIAILGLFLNWLGDSLDGTLARYRKIERPDFGYFLDHSCDLISQTLIFVGLGLSPYFTLFSAQLALSMYLLMTSFTYLKVLVLKTHHLSYYGMGATELRFLVMAWALFALWYGPGLIDAQYMGVRVIDLTIFGCWSLVFVAFLWKVWSDTMLFRPLLDK